MAALTYRNVTVNGRPLEVAVTERFTGPHLLLFLHGLGASRHCFDVAFQAPELGAFALCSLDWIGHGDSDKPADFGYSLQEQAAIGLEVAAQTGYSQVSIVAHSMGAGIGVLMAERMAPVLDRFVSIEGLLVGGPYSKRITSYTEQEFITSSYYEQLENLRESPQRGFREWAQWFSKASPHAVYKSAQSMVQWAESGRLFQHFNALPRKAYIYGDNDNFDILQPHFSNVKTVHVSGGHFLMQDNPRELYQALQTCLLG